MEIKEVIMGAFLNQIKCSRKAKLTYRIHPVRVLTWVTLTLSGILILLTQCKTTQKTIEIKKEMKIEIIKK